MEEEISPKLPLGRVECLARYLAHWVLDSPTGKSGPVGVPSLSAQKRKGIVVGYSVYLGSDGDVRRQRRFFRHRSDAEKFMMERNTSPLPVGELWERRAELLYNLERLRSVKSSLTDVVTFYLTNQGSVLGQKRFSDVVEEFLREKQQSGRSQHYDRAMRQTFGRFMKVIGEGKKIGDVTRQVITDYVYRTNKHVSSASMLNVKPFVAFPSLVGWPSSVIIQR